MNNCLKKRRLCCAECGAEFEPWENVFTWEGGYVCCDCFDSLCAELDRYERAELLGSEVLTAEDILQMLKPAKPL